MRKFGKKIIKTALLAVVTMAVMTTSIFAWYFTGNTFAEDFSASSVNFYFAGGNGSKETPYILNAKRHVYNMSWLQYLGRFQSKVTYFTLAADIDMDGLAIPPIGTEENPFYGTFYGNGHVIKNAWVSTIPDEIISDLLTEDFNPGTYVGFFGVIDSVAELISGDMVYTKIGFADNFYLEDLKISTATNDVTVGLIAGYVNGSLTEVGVSNGYMRLNSGLNVKSNHSLIGEKGILAFWEGEPAGTEGGDLIIDPNPLNGTPFTAVTGTNYRQVPEAIKDRAFYVGALTLNENKFVRAFSRATTVYDYNGVASTVPAPATQSPEFLAKFQRESNNNQVKMIGLGTTPPNATTTTTGTLSNGTSIVLPRRSIYFRPQGKGTCAVAFSTQSAGETLKVALYRFKRTVPGNYGSAIDADTFQKAASFTGVTNNNGDTHYFEVEFTSEDVRSGYEYVIGADTGATSAPALVYFCLPGTNVTGGPEEAPLIQRIDYVYRSGAGGTFPNLANENYLVTNTMLAFNGTTTAEFRVLYYKALKPGQPKALVYYWYSAAGITITELVTVNPESGRETTYEGPTPPYW